MPTDKPYRVGKPISVDEVPDWIRREPKWDDLARDVINLAPGDSLPVEFDSVQEAKNARTAVRNTVNEKLGYAGVRTRLVARPGGKAIAYFIRTKS